MKSADVEFADQLPEGYALDSNSLFYAPEYLDLVHSKIVSFCATEHSSRSVVLIINFQIIDDQAISLREAPFGGLEVLSKTEPNMIRSFMDYVFTNLKRLEVKSLVIKNPPSFHQDFISNQKLFGNTKFKTSYEINHHLEVGDEAFDRKLAPMQRRRLQKCEQAGFGVKQENHQSLSFIYSFIEKCRQEKRQEISISFNQLQETIKILPKNYHMFGCYDKDRLIAASICVAVNDKVLYHFLPASLTSYNDHSPMVFLIAEIYKYCQSNGVQILDLGTSMLNNKPNNSLATFKSRMGAIETERAIYLAKL